MTSASPRALIGVLTIGGMFGVLMNALLIPVIPELPRLLSSNIADTTWVVTATLISAAVCTPILGRLGDQRGKRRVYIVILVVLIVGSVISALSTSLVPLVVGRSIQGVGVGIVPIGISILRDQLSADAMPTAVALVSASLGVGSSIGLPLSTVVIASLGWHAVFWIAAVLSGVLIVLTLAIVPPDGPATGGRLDIPGALGLAAWLVPLLIVVTKGSSWGWTSLLVIALIVEIPVVAVLWGLGQVRGRSPLVDLRLAARRSILLTNISSLMLGFAMFASNLVFPQMLRAPRSSGSGLGLPILEAGIALAPLGLVMMLFSPVGARVSSRHGPRTSLIAGGALVALSYTAVAAFHSELWQVVAGIVGVGIGVGFAYAAMPSLIMRSAPVDATASANALNALMRSLGTSISSAVLGAVFAAGAIEVQGGEWPSGSSITVGLAIAATAAVVSALLAVAIPRVDDIPP